MRFGTRRGTLWTDPEYGLLIEDYLNDGITQEKLARLPQEIRNEALKEPGVDRVDVTSTIRVNDSGGARIRLSMIIYPSGESEPLPLDLEIGKVSVQVLTKGA